MSKGGYVPVGVPDELFENSTREGSKPFARLKEAEEIYKRITSYLSRGSKEELSHSLKRFEELGRDLGAMRYSPLWGEYGEEAFQHYKEMENGLQEKRRNIASGQQD